LALLDEYAFDVIAESVRQVGEQNEHADRCLQPIDCPTWPRFFSLDSNNQEMPSEAAFPKTANVQPNNRMPVCPNCESEVEYKGGMICPNCGFDFMRYL
jgi:hypothetical protein